MPSPFSSLLLAMSLGVLSTGAAAQTAPNTATVQAPSRPAASAPTPTPTVTSSTPSGTTKVQNGKAKPSKASAGKAPTGKTAGKAAGKPSAGNLAAGKAAKTGKAADCDSPEAKVAATAPPPVAADPLAPTLAPCAEPTRKP